MAETIADERWRVLLLRAGKKVENITPYITAVTWDDGPTAVMTGSLTAQYPPFVKHGLVVVGGDRIILQGANGVGQPFRRVWEMRCYEPQRSFAADSSSLSLADDLHLLELSEGDFRYVRNKRSHPRGWLTHEVIRDVCRRFGIPHAAIPKMRHRIKHLVRLEASPLDVIVAALKQERVATGRRFTLSMRSGKLVIRPLYRSNALYELGPTLIEATISSVMKENFGTTMVVRGRQQDEHVRVNGHKRVKHHKIAVRVTSKPAVRRYGYVQRVVYAPDADTPAEARKLGLRHLARLMHPDREATLQHEGIIGVMKGAAMRVKIPSEGLNVLVWVSQASHSVSAQDYTMDLTLKFDDPFGKPPVDKVSETLDAVATKRKRVPPKKKKKQPPKKGTTTKVTPPPPSPELGGVPTPP